MSPRELKKAEKELKREFPDGIPTCGTDALRFTLASYLQQGRQINMDVQRVVSYRHFCNKIWNAVRYALPLLETSSSVPSSLRASELAELKPSMGLADRWILSRLVRTLALSERDLRALTHSHSCAWLAPQAQTVETINRGIASNHLATSAAAMQRFFVQDLCDVYIEFSKPVLYGNRVDASEFASDEARRARQLSAQATLFQCLDYSMRLLHPFIPFVTEELWCVMRVWCILSAIVLVRVALGCGH